MFHLILCTFSFQNEENKNYLIRLHSISVIFLSYFPIILTSTLQKLIHTQVLKKKIDGEQNVTFFTSKMQVGGYSFILGRLTTWLQAALDNLRPPHVLALPEVSQLHILSPRFYCSVFIFYG